MTNKKYLSLSPTSINCFKQSELVFFYTYISKEILDTSIPTCYGNAGNIVHKVLEEYFNDSSLDINNLFNEKWNEKNLNYDAGIDGKLLDKGLYFKSVDRGIRIIKNNYEILLVEEDIKIILSESETLDIYIRGIIDLIIKKDDEKIIIDWKTSSTIYRSDSFNLQAKHYCLLYYLKYNNFIKKVIFYYIKIGKEIIYEFTVKEILEYYEYVKNLSNIILNKGNNINNYEVGNINSIFNGHYKKCIKEKNRRNKCSL